MLDRCIVTVSDRRGTRCFYFSARTRRLIAASLAMLVLFLLGGVVSIILLAGNVSDANERVHDLKALSEKMQHEKVVLQQEKEKLAISAAENAVGLDALGKELRHIEAIVDLKPPPDAAIQERIDAASLAVAQKRVMLNSIPSGYPVDEQFITSHFGTRTHPVNGNRSFHGGVDLRSPRGAPVYATADGVVEWAAKHRGSGLGKMVILVHNFGFTSLYGHLDDIQVRVGDFVKKGDVIGLVGNTGVSTAPHLHYEVQYLKRRIDPEPFMAWSMEDFYSIVFEKKNRVKWQAIAEAVQRNIWVPQEKPAAIPTTFSSNSR